ncbi:MAG TPA: hypothetical protein VKZ60_13835 [Chloroflexota bacterium]|nr:hypothetical protein [Chloroflexota bacterium]
MRSFYASVGVALFLLLVLCLQPFRDVARGRAAEQVLSGASPPVWAGVLVAEGVLRPRPDVRRAGPVEPAPTGPLGGLPVAGGPPRGVLPPGSLLVRDGRAIPVEGYRVALSRPAAQYAYGQPVALYGRQQGEELEAWGLADDRAGLQALAAAETWLVRWPGLLLGLVLGIVGYLLAAAGTLAFRKALARHDWPGPRFALVALALYLLLGYLLLGSAWAMLWPTVAGLALTGLLVWWLLARPAMRPSAAR